MRCRSTQTELGSTTTRNQGREQGLSRSSQRLRETLRLLSGRIPHLQSPCVRTRQTLQTPSKHSLKRRIRHVLPASAVVAFKKNRPASNVSACISGRQGESLESKQLLTAVTMAPDTQEAQTITLRSLGEWAPAGRGENSASVEIRQTLFSCQSQQVRRPAPVFPAAPAHRRLEHSQ